MFTGKVFANYSLILSTRVHETLFSDVFYLTFCCSTFCLLDPYQSLSELYECIVGYFKKTLGLPKKAAYRVAITYFHMNLLSILGMGTPIYMQIRMGIFSNKIRKI